MKLPHPYSSDKQCHRGLGTYDKQFHQRHPNSRSFHHISSHQVRSVHSYTENIRDGRSSSLKRKDCHSQNALVFSDRYELHGVSQALHHIPGYPLSLAHSKPTTCGSQMNKLTKLTPSPYKIGRWKYYLSSY